MLFHRSVTEGSTATLYVDNKVLTVEVLGGWSCRDLLSLITPVIEIEPPPIVTAVALYDTAELLCSLWDLHEASDKACKGKDDKTMPVAIVVRPDQMREANDYCRTVADLGMWREAFTSREDAFRWAARTSALIKAIRR